jgi:hypothetical protein
MIDTPEHCAYPLFINSKEGMTMAFDLSQYIPLNVFVMIWVFCMLAGLAFASRNDKEGK